MALPFLARSTRPSIRNRLEGDDLVRLQKKYGVYYRTFDRQEGTRVWQDGVERVMLSSNDYLGLGNHPRVIEAGKRALETWGSSTTGARLANGSRRFHEELEAKLAAFLGKEACMVSSAGYLSCMAAVAGFAQRGDRIYADKNIHSSLVSGITLSGARVERFAHDDARDLREALESDGPEPAGMLVFEGVYSMEGHIAPIPELLDLAQEYDLFTVVDEAHSFGVLGEQGRGAVAMAGETQRADILCGSFSKALSSTGGFIAGSREAIDFLRVHAKAMIFSAALSPVQAACASAALDLLQEEPEHLEKLWRNVRRYQAILNQLELDTWGSQTPALPIVIGNKEKAYVFWKTLINNGVFAVLSIAPAVPPGKDLIRTAISARHTDEDFELIENALRKAAK